MAPPSFAFRPCAAVPPPIRTAGDAASRLNAATGAPPVDYSVTDAGEMLAMFHPQYAGRGFGRPALPTGPRQR